MRYANHELLELGREPPLPATPAEIVRALEPMLSAERLARIRTVVDARLASVVVVLDGIEDSFNAAAVLRSCDAFGVQEVHVIEHDVRFRPARRVTMGAHKWLDVRRHRGEEGGARCVRELRARGFRTLAATMQGQVTEKELADMERVAIVMGNENRGVGPAALAAVDGTFRVAMRGFVESFNVSVATALALHGATGGRAGDLGAEQRERLYARLLLSAVREGAAIVERALVDTAARASDDTGGGERP